MTTTAPDGRTRQLATGTIRCRLWQNCILFEDARGDSHSWECSYDDPGLNVRTSGYASKTIVAPGNRKFNDFFQINGAESGKTVFVVSEAELTEDQMIVEPGNVVGLEKYDPSDVSRDDPIGEGGIRGGDDKPLRGLPTRRKLASSMGTLNALVVRVNAQDSSPPAATALSEDIFDDEYCLKSQYNRCSHGQLQIQEYIPGAISSVPTAPNAPGVVDVSVNVNAIGNTRQAIQAAANTELKSLLGVDDPGSLFDLVMFCMPPGTGSWIAYAYINKWDSYYNNDWCQSFSSQMHEVGHSIGLHHSGEYEGSDSNREYGDQTDMMGFSYRSDDTPAMCFNPAKNWQLGWFEGQQIALDPNTDLGTEPTSFILNGVVDYEENMPGKYIVIRINNFYIGFNRAADFNIGVQEAPNQVTIIEKMGEPSTSTVSKLAAKLSVGGEYTIELSELLSVKVVYESNTNSRDATISLSILGDLIECVGGYNAEVTVDLTTDNYPTETSWGIADPTGQTIFFKDDYTSRGSYSTTVGGLCRGLEYKFFINDKYGDGICCQWGTGSYVVKYQGEDLFSGGDFDSEEIVPFTLPQEETPPPVPSPTKDPTPSPTKNPTPSPTKNPTSSPTVLPTSSPTSSPTFSPTGGPTSSPTSSPTLSPTGGPTSGPTSSPTLSPSGGPIGTPTGSPTAGPTLTPTLAPTASPTQSPTNGVAQPDISDGCVDDPKFVYRNKADKDCSWVAKGKDRVVKIKCLRRAAEEKSDSTKVWAFCRETCDRVGVKKACS